MPITVQTHQDVNKERVGEEKQQNNLTLEVVKSIGDLGPLLLVEMENHVGIVGKICP
jgi:hypothetical protein